MIKRALVFQHMDDEPPGLFGDFLHERERLTRESHASFKSTRERVRDEIAARMPLFGFYRSLLRWLFVDPSEAPPIQEGVEVVLTD